MNLHYTCPRCSHDWEDTWPCAADDDCPVCGMRHISPTEVEDEAGPDPLAKEPTT